MDEPVGTSTELVLASLLKKMSENLGEASTLLSRAFAQTRADLDAAAEQLVTIAATQGHFTELVPGLTVEELTLLGSRVGQRPVIVATSPPLLEVANILVLTAGHYGVSVEELLGKQREHARIRYYAMWLIRHIEREPGEPEWSFPRIAKLFDMRDHTTALRGVEEVDRLRLAADGHKLTATMGVIARRARSAARPTGEH